MESETDAPPVSAISLEGHFVRLRPISREDYGFLWECRCHPDIMHLWMGMRSVPSFERYTRELDAALAGQVLTMLLIETRTNRRPVGFLYAYDYDSYDRCVFWSIAVHPAYTNVGWGAEASLLFVNYLFAFFDLRKVCCEVYAFNQHSLRLMLRMGAQEEARLVDHRYYQNSYHDVIRLVATPVGWQRAREKWLAILARGLRGVSKSTENDSQHPTAESQPEPKALSELAPPVLSAIPDTDKEDNGSY